MSKSHKSPNKRPIKRVQPNKAESHDKQISGSRRRLFNLGLGLAGAVLAGVVAERAGLFDVFKGEEKRGADIYTKTNEFSEYEEWASKIGLPEVEYNDASNYWTSEKAAEYLLSKGGDRAQLGEFYRLFKESKGQFLDGLMKIEDIDERKRFINNFFIRLFTSMPLKNGLNISPEGGIDTRASVDHLNRLLIPTGMWLGADREQGDKYDKYALFEVEDIDNLTIKTGGLETMMPVVFLKNQQDILIDRSEKPIEFNGAYLNEGGYMIFSKEQILSLITQNKVFENVCEKLAIKTGTLDQKTIFGKILETSIKHEAMHATLYQIVKKQSKDEIKRFDEIDMGNYVLNGNRFGPANHMQIHELAAQGFGLMHSGELAPRTAFWIHSTAQFYPNYNLANFVILNEIINSPSLNDDRRQNLFAKLSIGKFTNDDMVTAVAKDLPNEELHKIGERMAKLGIYLAQ